MTAEGEQLLRELGCSLTGPTDLQDVVANAFPGLQFVQHERRVAQDHGQQVVEIVRDTAGEPPHRFHLLRVPELLFGASQLLRDRFAGGDVLLQRSIAFLELQRLLLELADQGLAVLLQ